MQRSWGNNVAGEACVFPEKLAAELVALGIATFLDAPPPAAPKAPEVKAPAAPPEDKALHAAPEKKGLFGKGK